MRVLAYVLLLAACSVPDKFFVGDARGGGDTPVDTTAYQPGDYVWIRSMSSIGTYGVADGAAGLVVVGDLTVTADFGCGPVVPAGATDIALAGFKDADASCVYSKSWGAAGSEFPFLDVLDPSGAPLIYGLTGSTADPYDLGQGSTATSGGADGFIGRYLATAPAWLKRINGPGDDKILTSARGAGSTVYGVGYFQQTTNFNGSTLTSLGFADIFVGRFDTFTGAVTLGNRYGGADNETATGSAPGPSGGLILAGAFNGALAFGGSAPALATAGSNDAFLAAIDSNGTPLWAVQFGGTGDESNAHIAVDGNGDIYMTGTFSNMVTFGSFPMTSAGLHDVYVVKLSGTDRSVIWATQYGGSGDDNVRGIAVDAHDNVAVTGWAATAIDGGTSLGGADALITEYDATNGNIRWRKNISTAGDDRAWSCVYGTGGDLYATINMGGVYDFGHEVIGPAAPSSVVLRIAP